MAIVMQVREDRAGEPGIEERSGYPLSEGQKAYVERTYEGCVLVTREENGRDDSDFYAVVWDEAEQRCKRVEYASTRGWTYLNGAGVDATEEVLAAAEAWLADWYFDRFRDAEDAREARVDPRDEVELTRDVRRRGRDTIPAGTRAYAIEQGANQYRTYYRNGYNQPNPRERTQIRWPEGQWWVNTDALRVVSKEVARRDDAELRRMAEYRASERGFYMPFTAAGWAVL